MPPGAGVGSAIGFLRAPFSFEANRSVYMKLSDFDAPPVIRTLSTSTKPLLLEIVSPLVAPAAAVCVSSATVSDMNKSPESPKAVRLDFAPVTAKSSAIVREGDAC